jgi:hypothetical protein
MDLGVLVILPVDTPLPCKPASRQPLEVKEGYLGAA